MIIFPAIELKKGRCVRLYDRDPERQLIYSEDPLAVAHRWADEGARWIHIVNLDGAFGEESLNPQVVASIVAEMNARGVQVQFGGGLRSLALIEDALGWGVARVMPGTVAIIQPDLVRDAVARFGAERIVPSIDAHEGKVAIHGWSETSTVTALELAMRLKAYGVERVVYTDIVRDGTHHGLNIAATGALAQRSGLKVIASGGIGHLNHLKQARWLEPYGVEGIVIGKALYGSIFTLAEALEMVAD